MKTLGQSRLQKMTAVLRERLDLALEILALSHQLAVLECAAKRPQFSQADRCVWVLLSTAWAQWRDAFPSCKPTLCDAGADKGWSGP